MEISSAFIVSAIIISFAAITITLTLIYKKKTLSLILFILFSLLITASLFYKKELVNLIKEKKTNHYKHYRKSLGYSNISDSPTLSDVLFTFGDDYFINKDSTYALFKVNEFLNNYDRINCIKDERINLDCFVKDYVSDGNLVLLRHNKVIFIGGNNHTRYYYKNYINDYRHGHKNYYRWSLSKIIEVYGNYSQVWSSSDNLKRIYRFSDCYFFLKKNETYFYGQAFSNDFNVLDHQLLVLNDRYREIK